MRSSLATGGVVLVACAAWAGGQTAPESAPPEPGNGAPPVLVLKVPGTKKPLPSRMEAAQWLEGRSTARTVVRDGADPSLARVAGGCVPGSILVVSTPELVGLPVEVPDAGRCRPPGLLPLRAMPASVLSGSFRVAEDETLPAWGWADVSLCRERRESIPVGRYPYAVGRDGAWQVRVPAACVEVALQAPGFGAVDLPRRVLRAGQVAGTGRHLLRRGADVAVKVVSADDGLPIAGAVVRVIPEARLPEAVALWARQAPGESGGGDRTSETGWATVGGVRPGVHHLFVEAEGRAPFLGEAFEVDGDAAGVSLDASVGSFASLEVRCPEAPDLLRRGMKLRVWLTPVVGGRRFSEQGLRDEAIGPHGSAEVDRLPPGRWTLELLLDEDGLMVRMDSTELDLASGERRELEMALGDTVVRGRVELRGQPVAAEMNFAPHERESADQLVTSDAEGAFVIVVPRPATYDVRVSGISPKLDATVPDVAIAPGDGEVVIELPDRQIEGSVVDRDGRSVEGAHVAGEIVRYGDPRRGERGLRAPLSVSGDSDRCGAFVLDGVAPDTWRLTARRGREESRTVTVVVPPKGSVARVVLQLGGKETLSGTVVDAAGGPVAGATVVVFAAPAATGEVFWGVEAVTRADGRFEAELDPDAGATAMIQVLPPAGAPQGYRTAARDGVVLPLPAASGAVRLAPSPATGWEGVPPLTHLVLLNDEGGALNLTQVLARGGVLDRSGSGSLLIPALAAGEWRLVYVEPSLESIVALFAGWPGRPVLAGFAVTPGQETVVTLPSLARKRTADP